MKGQLSIFDIMPGGKRSPTPIVYQKASGQIAFG